MTFIFALKPVEEESLLPQLSAALEKRAELISREQLPGLWRLTDRLDGISAVPKPVLLRRTVRYRAWGAILLILGVLLFVPGLAAPREMAGPLVVGTVAAAWGLFCLFGRRRAPKMDFDTPAQRLLSDLSGPGRKGAHVLFSEEGLALETPDGERETIAYRAIEYALETEGLLLLTDATRVVTLQKSELSWGDWNDFHAFLTERVETLVDIRRETHA